MPISIPKLVIATSVSVLLIVGCAVSHDASPPDAAADAEAYDEVRGLLADNFELGNRAEARYCECTGCEPSPTSEAYIDCIAGFAMVEPTPFLDYYGAWMAVNQMMLECLLAADCDAVADGACTGAVDDELREQVSAPPPPEVSNAVMRCAGL